LADTLFAHSEKMVRLIKCLRITVAPPPLFAQHCSLHVLLRLSRDGKMNMRLIARRSSLPRVAIPFNLTPFPLTATSSTFLRRVSFAEGERYGNSTRRSCICLKTRSGFNHAFRVNIRPRITANRELMSTCASGLRPLNGECRSVLETVSYDMLS
jgi:hypothetical protein